VKRSPLPKRAAPMARTSMKPQGVSLKAPKPVPVQAQDPAVALPKLAVAPRKVVAAYSIRQLRPGEPDPEGEPKLYPQGPYMRLRWKIGTRQYVERYKRNDDGSLWRSEPIEPGIDYQRARELYVEGKSLTQTAAELGCDTGNLSRGLRKLGVQMRTTGDYATPIDAELVKRLYVDERHGLHVTARLAGCEDVGRIRECLIAQGIRIRGRGRVPGVKFNEGIGYETEFKHMRPVIAARSAGRCEIEGPGCTGLGEHVHHRKMRSQGGDNSLACLVHACNHCHKRIHEHPEESYANGWLLHFWQDPAAVVIVRRGEAAA
jgi:hypothetical protein